MTVIETFLSTPAELLGEPILLTTLVLLLAGFVAYQVQQLRPEKLRLLRSPAMSRTTHQVIAGRGPRPPLGFNG